MMKRYFNTTGPCDPRWHYMLPPEARVPELLGLVEQRLYFVVHAPRQTGKTTAMRAFAARLRDLGYAAIYATLETSQGEEDVAEAEARWLYAIEHATADLPEDRRPPPRASAGAYPVGERTRGWLSQWSEGCSAPVVLLLDEADVITGPPLVSLLRQLRAGFSERPGRFPASISLIGMRDLRDYLTASKSGGRVNPGSPFNIKSDSITLRNFTADEVASLTGQHTADTGQRFEPEAVERVFYWSQGQPFLVNALARKAVMELVKDPSQPITAGDIDQAKELLIRSRTTHLDALAERLREPRVARVVQAVLTGDLRVPYDHDDFQYVLDLGLIRKTREGAEPANPLYREVLGRQLTYNLQENLPLPRWRWRTAEGRLDMAALVREFLAWWRENSDVLVEDVPEYPEAIPHLAFMAFLQRVINGGGQVHREYAAGRMALDLLVTFGDDRFVLELKRIRARDSLERVREAAIQQTLRYLEVTGEREGWVILFDQRPGRSWEARLWQETVERDGKVLWLRGA